MPVKTIEMEVAVMEHLDIRRNLIVPNISWGIAGLHECDLLSLSKSNYATEIEIKISKADLLKDKEKKHGHRHNHITLLYFAVPKKLAELALTEIPERAGLLMVEKYERNYETWRSPYRVTELRKAKRNKFGVKWSNKERYELARLGSMRILGMKKKLI